MLDIIDKIKIGRIGGLCFPASPLLASCIDKQCATVKMCLVRKTVLIGMAVSLSVAVSGCGGDGGGGSSSAVTPSAGARSAARTSAIGSEVTVRFTGARTLFGYALKFSPTQTGLTLGRESDCKTLLDTAPLAAVNTSNMTIVSVSNEGFSGSANLFKCSFTVGSSVTTVPVASDYILSGSEAPDGNGTSNKITASDYQVTVNQ